MFGAGILFALDLILTIFSLLCRPSTFPQRKQVEVPFQDVFTAQKMVSPREGEEGRLKVNACMKLFD